MVSVENSAKMLQGVFVWVWTQTPDISYELGAFPRTTQIRIVSSTLTLNQRSDESYMGLHSTFSLIVVLAQVTPLKTSTSVNSEPDGLIFPVCGSLIRKARTRNVCCWSALSFR